jgi:hypothetical protein
MEQANPPTFDMSGWIDHIQLVDLIQLACPSRKSLTLRVASDDGRGDIHIREGQVAHVATGDLEGEEALFGMLLWKGGSFEAVEYDAGDIVSVHKPWEYLLIDAMRFCDERSLSSETPVASETAPNLFKGSVNKIQLLDIVQLVCIMRTSHVVGIHSEKRRGKIWLRSGQVRHAQADALQGEDALFEMLLWKGGSFEATYEPEEQTITISKPWELLVVKAVRLREEAANKDGEEEPEKEEGLAQQVLRMKTGAKIRLAMTGSKEARGLLISDGNRLVQLALVSNVKITESEVYAIASCRSVDEEVIRKIAANREWMKSYQIRQALVNNPKSPVAISMKLVPTLLPRDLKSVAKSRAIPTAIVQAARRLVVHAEP